MLALVRGSAVNQDGPSSGQTVPSGPAQQAVLRAALASARLEPSEIDYIEAHGTGTALGDPIELDALSAVFGQRDDSAPLVLGSVKTNLGHLENSAGIAGFIKTVLSMNHGYIPPHLHFTGLTPNAGAGASKFTIAADGMPWPEVSRPRRAGVSSFGVSGTNAHVVIEQAPVTESVAAQPEPAGQHAGHLRQDAGAHRADRRNAGRLDVRCGRRRAAGRRREHRQQLPRPLPQLRRRRGARPRAGRRRTAGAGRR